MPDHSELIARLRLEPCREDAERFNWYFGSIDKVGFLPAYAIGIRDHWTPDQWRSAIDAAIVQEGKALASPTGTILEQDKP